MFLSLHITTKTQGHKGGTTMNTKQVISDENNLLKQMEE